MKTEIRRTITNELVWIDGILHQKHEVSYSEPVEIAPGQFGAFPHKWTEFVWMPVPMKEKD